MRRTPMKGTTMNPNDIVMFCQGIAIFAIPAAVLFTIYNEVTGNTEDS